MIPKIIHQTWKTSEIPERWKLAVNSCKKKYNDYQYILWTDEMMEKFVKTEYPDFFNVYDSYKENIQRCDAFRYLVLYKYGGVYIDMDIICKKNFDNLLSYDLVLAKSSNMNNFFTNSFFMSTPNNPFMKFCIDNLPDYKDSFKYFGNHFHIMNSTGPIFLTKMINKYGLENIKNIHVLSNAEFAGDCSQCTEKACKGGIYFNHVAGNSWHSFDSKIINILLCNWKIILLIILFAIFVVIIYKNRLFKKIKKMI